MNMNEKQDKPILIKSKTADSIRSPRNGKNPVSARSTAKSTCTKNGASARSTTSNPKWIISGRPKTYLTKGPSSRRAETFEFSYDLSRDESEFTHKFSGPMKALSSQEKVLQQSGRRETYLNTRYEHGPVQKYNFPEATSWRIGWFVNPKESSSLR